MPVAKFSVPRVNPRFSFIAEAEVVTVADQLRMVARIFELSSQGCYVDTVNPFPIDTELRLCIRYGCSTCDLPGKVIYTHSGYGMGVRFGEISALHRHTLEGWLEELSRKIG